MRSVFIGVAIFEGSSLLVLGRWESRRLFASKTWGAWLLAANSVSRSKFCAVEVLAVLGRSQCCF
jgi:hypothetical protein